MAASPRTVVCGLLTWLASVVTVAHAEVCSYTTYAYNHYDQRNEMMVSFKSCQWGCCWKFQPDPCCEPPVGLIVGGVFGAAFCLFLLVVVCCCCCCGNLRRQQRQQGVVVRYPHQQQGGSGVHISNTPPSGSAANETNSAITTSLPPGVYQPPPSYDEVMAGEINHAFKPDSYPNPPPPPPPPPAPQ